VRRCRSVVVRRHVLAAIAKGVAAGDLEVARGALEKIDWVVRGRARRRLESALIDAALATGVMATDDAASARHVLRAAALVIRGEAERATSDPAAVTVAYGDDEPAASRVPIVSILTGVLALTVTTLVVAGTMSVKPRGDLERPAPPPAVGAYRDGGEPARDQGIETVLAAELAKPNNADRAPVALARWPEVADAWRAMIEAVESYGEGDDEDLRVRVQVVSDQLAGAGLGYFVDVELPLGGTPVLIGYRVEKVTFVRADRDRIRVLDMRRLAGRAERKPWLGMKPEGFADAIVLRDHVETYVRLELLPVLEGYRYELADDAWAHTKQAKAAANAATRAIRRELATAVGARADAGPRIEKLLVASVRHHEAHHGYEQDREPVQPEVLVAHVGPIRSGRKVDERALRARNELSAYTSQIASDMWMPQVALWSLARHAFRPARRNSPEAVAAVVVLEGLARQLGISTQGTALRGDAIDREKLAELVGPLSAVPTIELRSAAARLWAELFGTQLVRLVDDVFGE
jgi:hypothetical protein